MSSKPGENRPFLRYFKSFAGSLIPFRFLPPAKNPPPCRKDRPRLPPPQEVPEAGNSETDRRQPRKTEDTPLKSSAKESSRRSNRRSGRVCLRPRTPMTRRESLLREAAPMMIYDPVFIPAGVRSITSPAPTMPKAYQHPRGEKAFQYFHRSVYHHFFVHFFFHPLSLTLTLAKDRSAEKS